MGNDIERIVFKCRSVLYWQIMRKFSFFHFKFDHHLYIVQTAKVNLKIKFLFFCLNFFVALKQKMHKKQI